MIHVVEGDAGGSEQVVGEGKSSSTREGRVFPVRTAGYCAIK